MFNYDLLNNQYIFFYQDKNFKTINALSVVNSLHKIYNIKLKDVIEISKIKPILINTSITFKNKDDAIKFIEVIDSMKIINQLKEC